MENNPSVSHDKEYEHCSDVTLQLKEEQLQIAKKWIETGKVKIYKETFIEDTIFTVPVKREELVIENTSFVSHNGGQENMPLEIIRIPLNEEQVKFSKKLVTLEDVSIYKEQIDDIKHIEATLKKEVFKEPVERIY
jgi:uncharacterized protein (TIGR02271 family)